MLHLVENKGYQVDGEETSSARSIQSILARFAEALARGDAEEAAACFAPDATYSEPPRFAFTGRAAIVVFFADFTARHRDVSFTVARVLAAPDGPLAAVEWRFAYTSNGNGARTVFEGMCWLELAGDGLIAHWRGFSARIEGS